MTTYTTVIRDNYCLVIPSDGAIVLKSLKVTDASGAELTIGADWFPILPYESAASGLATSVYGGIVLYIATPTVDMSYTAVPTSQVDYATLSSLTMVKLLSLTLEAASGGVLVYTGSKNQQVGDVNRLYGGLKPIAVVSSPEAILGLTSHMGDKVTVTKPSDPHLLTAGQVGLGNVPNWSLGGMNNNGYTTPKACINILMNIIPDATYTLVGKMKFIPKPIYSIPTDLFAITAFDLTEYLKFNSKYLQHLMAVRVVSLERGLNLQYPSLAGTTIIKNYQEVVDYFSEQTKIINPIFSDELRCIFTSPGMYPKILDDDKVRLRYYIPPTNTGGSGGGTGGGSGTVNLSLADLRQPQYVISLVTYTDGTELYASSPSPTDPSVAITYQYIRPWGETAYSSSYATLISQLNAMFLTPTTPFSVAPDDPTNIVKVIEYTDGTMLYCTNESNWYYKRPNGERGDSEYDPYPLMTTLYRVYGLYPI